MKSTTPTAATPTHTHAHTADPMYRATSNAMNPRRDRMRERASMGVSGSGCYLLLPKLMLFAEGAAVLRLLSSSSWDSRKVFRRVRYSRS